MKYLYLQLVQKREAVSQSDGVKQRTDRLA